MIVSLQATLVAVSVDHARKGWLALTGPGGSLPTRGPGAGETTYEAAAALLRDCLGVDARRGGTGWEELRHCPVYDPPGGEGPRLVLAPYCCVLPADIARPADPAYRWAEADKLSEQDQELVNAAVRELIR
jgi:hypothetical protein